jgi:hypothetical protein
MGFFSATLCSSKRLPDKMKSFRPLGVRWLSGATAFTLPQPSEASCLTQTAATAETLER